MPIARSASAPVRARPLTVAARVGALWDEAVAALWESSLAWFDRSERPAVLAMHRG